MAVQYTKLPTIRFGVNTKNGTMHLSKGFKKIIAIHEHAFNVYLNVVIFYLDLSARDYIQPNAQGYIAFMVESSGDDSSGKLNYFNFKWDILGIRSMLILFN
jgi:hypothetical protein